MSTYVTRLFRCGSFVLFCFTASLFALLLTLFHLPFRIFKRLMTTPSPPGPPPKVSITIHTPPTLPIKDTLLFIHGFPDSPALFLPQIPHLLSKGYRLLVAELPTSQGDPISRALTPQETAHLLYRALIEIHDKAPVTIIAHDWGTLYALILQNAYPNLCHRAVFIDVGMFKNIHPYEWLVQLSYQLMLALGFLLGDPAATFLVRAFMRFTKYSLRPISELTGSMSYPYVGYFQTAPPGLMEKAINASEKRKTVPHLFVYGRKKLVRFHDDQWLQFVKDTPEGQVIGLPCGHWVSHECADEFNVLVEQWLGRSEAAISKAG